MHRERECISYVVKTHDLNLGKRNPSGAEGDIFLND